MFMKTKLIPNAPPDSRVATQVPIMIRKSVMPMMRGKLQLLSGVKRPIKFM